MIIDYKNHTPKISDSAFIAPNATVIGDVEIGEHSSVLFGSVVRGDIAPVRIGNYTNVQDLSVLHQTPGLPLTLEDNVTIGHKVTLHSCTVKKGALVGMDSIVLDEAVIGENSFIGAGSLVTGGTVIPPNTLAFGRPAKVVRELTEEDLEEMKRINETYVGHIPNYKN
ncbi:Carnitine operon protein CaiE [Jeotgalicoccus aerolatus]|uniref:Carbonic anhydrase/acetyltransferase-like protein (Isoleucine patch superfamily) n=1 Tax=Jeotgalicoccus aerolatus TaxID=709510 RepID=A0ABS4HQE4_9STAP|nr:gamma carbonic anhydrase family protein [Jeotgalicoccus aerolatus]MBP1952592.1 carbonic anhydrase/acetyltransferase-like protein (isoleucine patch superfamily) [Jeotgalicoccus aerolatus]NMA80899.1 gamma carbonic anhydrase family protein [Jeotgalicoccus aerolatus]GGD92470.1 gamma carbonic anhydrase family protein [Jeotgalicoccus aerolatus]CAD2074317.1 Carnitine operon protein CaiE [Jeotgalicoccus aerolatus]